MAIKKIYELSVDMKRTSVRVNVPVLVQGDSAEFRIRLADNGVALSTEELNGITSVTMQSGFDAQTIIETIGTLEGSVAVFRLQKGELFRSGTVQAMVQLADADDRISTLRFEYQVIPELSGNYIPGEQDITVFQRYMNDAQAKIDEMAATDVAHLTAQLAETDETLNLRVDELVIASGNANAEVTDAHVSTEKSKTFTTIRNRFEESEKDYKSITNLYPAKNKFANSKISPTVISTGTGSRVHTLLSGSWAVNSSHYSTTQQVMDIIEGHIYYAKAQIKSTSVGRLAGGISILYSDNTRDQLSSSEVQNDLISDGFITATKSGLANVYFTTSSVAGEIAKAHQLFIDVTEIFGAGNEPTLEELRDMLSFYPDGFDGTVNFLNKSSLKFLLDATKNENNPLAAELVATPGDSNSIISHLETLAGLGGGKLIVPPGQYVFSDPDALRLTDNIHMVGYGVLTEIRLANGINPYPVATETGFLLSNADHVNGNKGITIENILINANREANTGNMHAVWFELCTDLTLKNVYGRGGFGGKGGHGVTVSRGGRINMLNCRGFENNRNGLNTTKSPTGVTIANCFGYNNGQQGIHTSTGEFVTVTGCVSIDNGTDGFDGTNATYSTFTGNVAARNGAAGFNSLNGSKSYVGNYAYLNAKEGFLFAPTGQHISNVVCSQNIAQSNGREGIKASKIRFSSFEGNVITGVPSTFDGILIDTLPEGGYTAVGLILSGNNIQGGLNSINIATAGFEDIIITNNIAKKGIVVAGAPVSIVNANNLAL